MLKQLKDSGQLTDVFRNALAQSAWLPSQAPSGITCTTTLWDKSKSGPGILNTEALLKVHLPPLVSALVSTGVEPDLPLFQSLVPSLSNSETIKLYVDLLGIPENKASEYFFLESEIMFHYTNNDDLRHAVDTYLSRPDTVTAASARSALISVSSPTLRKLILGPQSE
jgi:hypothetical protein